MMRGYQRPRMFKVLRHTVSIKVKKGEIQFVRKDTEDNNDEKIPKVENAIVNGRCRSLTLSHCISGMCLRFLACS